MKWVGWEKERGREREKYCSLVLLKGRLDMIYLSISRFNNVSGKRAYANAKNIVKMIGQIGKIH